MDQQDSHLNHTRIYISFLGKKPVKNKGIAALFFLLCLTWALASVLPSSSPQPRYLSHVRGREKEERVGRHMHLAVESHTHTPFF